LQVHPQSGAAVNETLADARKFASHLIEEHALPFLSDRVDDLKLLLHDKLGHAVVDLAHNEAVGRMAFESLYEFLPAPVRLVVKREMFTRYCLENKTRILALLEPKV